MNIDLIFLIKALILGLIWGGTLFFSFAFILNIFPIPSIYKLYNILGNWAAKRPIEKAPKWYQFRYRLMQICAILLWCSIIAIYIVSFDAILSVYVPKNTQGYYIYYALSVLTPAIWFGYKAFSSFLDKVKKDKSSHEQLFQKQNNTSLIEQIQRKA